MGTLHCRKCGRTKENPREKDSYDWVCPGCEENGLRKLRKRSKFLADTPFKR